MKLLYKAVKNLQEEKKSAEDKAMIDTYNQKVSFILIIKKLVLLTFLV